MPPAIHPDTRIGHVHLKVADLDRALAFYRGVLGFNVTQRIGNRPPSSPPAATTTTSASTPGRAPAAPRPPPDTTGLYHLAILYPTRAALADALRRLATPASPSMAPPTTASAKPSTSATPTTTASNSTGTTPNPTWPRTPTGDLAMVTEPLDLRALLAEAPEPNVPAEPANLPS